MLSAALFFFMAGCGDTKLGNWYIEDTEEEIIDESAIEVVGEGVLNDASGVAVYGSFIYVTDPNRDSLFKLDQGYVGTADEKVWEVGTLGEGELEFSNPADVVVDIDGDIYVADTGNSRIQKISRDGVFLKEWGSDILEAPVGLFITVNGYLYVTDKNLGKVFKYTSEGIKEPEEFGMDPNTAANGSLSTPTDIAVGINGDIYIVNSGNDRIEVFGPDGTYKFNFNEDALGETAFLSPYSIAVDTNGILYVSDTDHEEVMRFDSDGNLKSSIDGAGDTGFFNTPMGIDTSGSWLFVAESGAKRVRKVPFSEFSL